MIYHKNDNHHSPRKLGPVERGCGYRVQAGIYAVCPMSPDRMPLERFLFDPPVTHVDVGNALADSCGAQLVAPPTSLTLGPRTSSPPTNWRLLPAFPCITSRSFATTTGKATRRALRLYGTVASMSDSKTSRKGGVQ